MKLDEGYINLAVHDTTFVAKMGRIQAILTKTSLQMQTVARHAKRMLLGGAVAVGFAVREYGMFERQMRRATAVSEVSSEQFAQMSKMAEAQSVRLNIAAGKAADAFYFLGSTELTVAEQMQAFIPVVTLAKAGLMGMGETAENVVDILAGFRIPATQTARVTDVLTESANNANATILQFSQSLKPVSGLALQTHNSLEEMAATMMVLASVGFKGQRAAMIMRRSLTRLMAPISSIRRLMEDYGIEVYDANGRMKPFIQLVGEISEKLQGASEAQKNMAFQTLFGQRAIVGQLAIFNRSRKGLEELVKMLEAAEGATERVAQKQLAAFWEQLGRVGRHIQMVARHIGMALEPRLRKLADTLNNVIPYIVRFVDENKEFIASIVLWTGKILIALVVIPKLISLVAGLFGIIIKLKAAMLGLGSLMALTWTVGSLPLVPLIGLVLGLVGAAYVLRAMWKKNTLKMRDKLVWLANKIKTIWAWITNNAIKPAYQWIVDKWDELWPHMAATFNKFTAYVVALWHTVLVAWDEEVKDFSFERLRELFKIMHADAMKMDWGATIKNSIVENFQEAADLVKEVWNKVSDSFAKVWEDAMEQLKEDFATFVTWVKEKLPAFISLIDEFSAKMEKAMRPLTIPEPKLAEAAKVPAGGQIGYTGVAEAWKKINVALSGADRQIGLMQEMVIEEKKTTEGLKIINRTLKDQSEQFPDDMSRAFAKGLKDSGIGTVT